MEADLGSYKTMNKQTDVKLESAIEAMLVQPVQNRVIGQVNVHMKTMKKDVSEALEIEKR